VRQTPDKMEQTEKNKAVAWSARFETVIPPDRPYVPRVSLMEEAQHLAASAGLPRDAVALVALQVCGVRDDRRASGWPFLDRHLTLTIVADRPAPNGRPSSGSSTHQEPASPESSVALRWRCVPWSRAEAAAWARKVGSEAESVMADSDYDYDLWGSRMASYMVAMRKHAQGQCPKPVRPRTLGAEPHGRVVVVGWLGNAVLPEVPEALALHLGMWSPPVDFRCRA
jgi:hypothetical protein